MSGLPSLPQRRSSSRLALGGLAATIAVMTLAACATDPLAASCGGDRVELCDPYEWAELAAPTFEPAELPIADPQPAHITVELATCDDAPAPHLVTVTAVVPEGAEGGARIVSLLELRDGEDGDVAGDGRIDVEVTNPFLATVPPDTDIVLRFSAKSTTVMGCTSGVVELPYRTGPSRS